MFVSKSSVIFFSLLILNVTLKSTQAMPADVEPREYDDDDLLADASYDYNFMRNEVDGLKEELENEYGDINVGENVFDERVDDSVDGTENDGDYVRTLEENEDDSDNNEEDPIDLGAVLEMDEEGEDQDDQEGEDQEDEDQGDGSRIVEFLDVELGEGDDQGEDEVGEGPSEMVDEENRDQIDEDLGEEVGDNGEGIDDQGKVVIVVGDEDPRSFPYVWLDKVKQYFKKARYYLGI